MLKTIYHRTGLLGNILTHKFPLPLWKRLSSLGESVGLGHSFFVLSFDCDTVEDAKVVLGMDARLREMGVKPVYAVPGDILRQSVDIYGEIAKRGAEFINHGNVMHTFWNEKTDRYESCFFYDRIDDEDVVRDILDGDRTLKDVLGITATGYRTPHFGCFQHARQMQLVHDTCRRLGYTFSSSAVPETAFWLGPVHKEYGLVEFPVSGSWNNPFGIQDSWGYFAAPGAVLGGGTYLEHARKMAEMIKAHNLKMILNYYADPSHIHDREEFYGAVRSWLEVGESATYSDIVHIVSSRET